MKRLRRMLGIIVGSIVVLVAVWIVSMTIWARRAERPTGLGVSDGRLAACPASPNCVSTQATLDSQKMPVLRYEGTQEAAKARLQQWIAAHGRLTMVEEQGDYLAYVFRSRLIGFPDDVEFLFDDANKEIHFRSASRLGQSDLGVNRARMDEVTRLFAGGT